MPTKPINSDSIAPVPIEFAGKWIVWSSDHARIVAQSDNVGELWRIVRDQRIHDPIFEKVPHTDTSFIGRR